MYMYIFLYLYRQSKGEDTPILTGTRVVHEQCLAPQKAQTRGCGLSRSLVDFRAEFPSRMMNDDHDSPFVHM